MVMDGIWNLRIKGIWKWTSINMEITWQLLYKITYEFILITAYQMGCNSTKLQIFFLKWDCLLDFLV